MLGQQSHIQSLPLFCSLISPPPSSFYSLLNILSSRSDSITALLLFSQGEECPQAQQARNRSCGVREGEARCVCGQINGAGKEDRRQRGLPSGDEVEPEIPPSWDMFRLLSLKEKKVCICPLLGWTNDQFCIILRTRTQTVIENKSSSVLFLCHWVLFLSD